MFVAAVMVNVSMIFTFVPGVWASYTVTVGVLDMVLTKMPFSFPG
jgi:hypothetical protein